MHIRPYLSSSPRLVRLWRLALTVALLIGLTLGVMPAPTTLATMQIDLIGPTGSGQFGKTVTVLSNGNIVVTDPGYAVGATAQVGAVYLYNGGTGAVISILTGSTANDQVGYGGVTALTNGNYVVSSYKWNNGVAAQAGAVTWCSGTAGCTGDRASRLSMPAPVAVVHRPGTWATAPVKSQTPSWASFRLNKKRRSSALPQTSAVKSSYSFLLASGRLLPVCVRYHTHRDYLTGFF